MPLGLCENFHKQGTTRPDLGSNPTRAPRGRATGRRAYGRAWSQPETRSGTIRRNASAAIASANRANPSPASSGRYFSCHAEIGWRISGCSADRSSARPRTSMPAISTHDRPRSMLSETRGSADALRHVRLSRLVETYSASPGQTNHSGTTWGDPSRSTVATATVGSPANIRRAADRSTSGTRIRARSRRRRSSDRADLSGDRSERVRRHRLERRSDERVNGGLDERGEARLGLRAEVAVDEVVAYLERLAEVPAEHAQRPLDRGAGSD